MLFFLSEDSALHVSNHTRCTILLENSYRTRCTTLTVITCNIWSFCAIPASYSSLRFPYCITKRVSWISLSPKSTVGFIAWQSISLLRFHFTPTGSATSEFGTFLFYRWRSKRNHPIRELLKVRLTIFIRHCLTE